MASQSSRFDISSNRISGTLDSFNSSLSVSNYTLTLNLADNRISGSLSEFWSNSQFSSVQLLTGNHFSCNSRGNYPGKGTHAVDSYSCGSEAYELALSIWGIICGIIIIALFVVFIVFLGSYAVNRNTHLQTHRPTTTGWGVCFVRSCEFLVCSIREWNAVTFVYNKVLHCSVKLCSVLVWPVLFCYAFVCSTLFFSTLLYSTLFYSTLLYYALLYSTLLSLQRCINVLSFHH